MSSKRNGYQSDDDNIRYKINTNHADFGKTSTKKPEIKNEEEDNIRYMFPTVLSKPKQVDSKPKPKPKIKVNFWSGKQSRRLHDKIDNKEKSSRRHTIATTSKLSPPKSKNAVVKVRKRVSFLPSPLFSENHVPMVTVPDDLTIHLNEEEANDLGECLGNDIHFDEKNDMRKSQTFMTQTSPKNNKRKRSSEDAVRNHGSDNELDFFSKYVVQKLRKMETNQRIYSENLINTVLMLGQLGKLNGKSKIGEA